MSNNQNDGGNHKNEGTANAKSNQGGHQQQSDTNMPNQGLKDDKGKPDSRNTSAQSSHWPNNHKGDKQYQQNNPQNATGEKSQAHHMRSEDEDSDRRNTERREEELKTKKDHKQTEKG